MTTTLRDADAFFRSFERAHYDAAIQEGAEPELSVIESFERDVGFALPDDFREFSLHPLGGAYLEANEEIWPPAAEGEVGPFWTFLRGVHVYGFSSAAPDWLQVAHAWREMREAGAPELVPFLKVIGGPDVYCFTRDGSIVIHESADPENPKPVDGGFYDVLMKELTALEERVALKLASE